MPSINPVLVLHGDLLNAACFGPLRAENVAANAAHMKHEGRPASLRIRLVVQVCWGEPDLIRFRKARLLVHRNRLDTTRMRQVLGQNDLVAELASLGPLEIGVVQRFRKLREFRIFRLAGSAI